MPKYRVVLSEVASYEIVVSAASEDAAAEKAEKIMATKGVAEFECEVHSRECDHIELIRPARAKKKT